MPRTMPNHAATCGRSPTRTPKPTGTTAARTAVTGEMMFMGARAIRLYMTITPTMPPMPPPAPSSAVRGSSGPENSGSSASISAAPTGYARRTHRRSRRIRRRRPQAARRRRPRLTLSATPVISRSSYRSGAGSRLGDRDLVDVEVPGAETRFGVSEIERPHAAERLVEAEPGHVRGARLEARTPAAKRLRVVPAEAEPLRDAHGCVAAHGVLDRLDRGELTAREDVLADPRVRLGDAAHAGVVLQDRLEAEAPAGHECAIDRAEVFGPIPGAHGFDHLDADHGVVAACRRSVVLQQHLGAVAEAGLRDPIAGERGLLGRDGQRRDRGAALRGPDRELAPSGTDLQQPAPFAHAGRVEQAVDLA